MTLDDLRYLTTNYDLRTHDRSIASFLEDCDSAGVGPRCRIANIGRPSTEFERAFVAAMVQAAARA